MRIQKQRMPGFLLGVMDGGSLERRVLRLIDTRLPWARRWRLVSAVACLLMLGSAGGMIAMLGVRISAAQQADLDVPKLEVISVKPNRGGPGSSFGMRADEVFATNATLQYLLEGAFEHQFSNTGQIVGLPGWSGSDHFDVVAKVDAAEVAKVHPTDKRNEMESAVLRRALEARFQLKTHVEEREAQVFELVATKGAAKLQTGDATRLMDKESQKNVPHGYAIGAPGGIMRSSGHIVGHAVKLQSLVDALMQSGHLDRVVVDHTGMTGQYDINLYWEPDGTQATDEDTRGLSLFAALEEQLGLKLVPAKAPVKVLVIDHVEKPTEN